MINRTIYKFLSRPGAQIIICHSYAATLSCRVYQKLRESSFGGAPGRIVSSEIHTRHDALLCSVPSVDSSRHLHCTHNNCNAQTDDESRHVMQQPSPLWHAWYLSLNRTSPSYPPNVDHQLPTNRHWPDLTSHSNATRQGNDHQRISPIRLQEDASSQRSSRSNPNRNKRAVAQAASNLPSHFPVPGRPASSAVIRCARSKIRGSVVECGRGNL